ncbi:small HSP21-like protein [Aphelenchoides avenae]|nr:small HSP21-like protein [Aphelenchus avenae]
MSSTHWPFSHHHGWVSPFEPSNLADFYSPHMRKHAHDERGLGQVNLTENGDFHWKCSIAGYLPDELKVDLEGNQLVVTAQHEEGRKGETVYRSLKRRCVLPEGISKESIKCHIDHHGHLMFEGSRHPAKEGEKHPIPIKQYLWPNYM